MNRISLCMIVKNEEELLAGCLESVYDICDEIIIVDTGSTDGTKDIASKFTDKIYDFEWIDDFAAARNFSFEKAKMDYILWLDADDIVKEEDRKELLSVKENLDGSQDAVNMLYCITFDEYGNPAFEFRRNRLVKRENGFKWIGPVHEYLEVGGNIIESNVRVTHRKQQKEKNANPRRNLDIYEKRLENGGSFNSRDLFYYANELKDNKQYSKAIHYYQEFLKTGEGWVEDEIRACLYIADCYRELGDHRREKEALALSMQFDVPRPEAVCKMGDFYKDKRLFEKAALWYELALEPAAQSGQGFVQKAYSTWYPHLQLCVCYSELGEMERASKHNSKAKKYLPNDPRVLNNEDFFARQLQGRINEAGPH